MRRGLAFVLLAAGAVVALALLGVPEEQHPVAVVGHTGPPETSTTMTVTTVPPTPTTPKAPVVAVSRSSTVVRTDAGGVTVVNEGSAVASTGGNTVIGPPDATVVNGPATAVGNVSRP